MNSMHCTEVIEVVWGKEGGGNLSWSLLVRQKCIG